ncbi:cysteine peptidase family C39 domain-containing protein [Clostridium beijerinckii]|uniref:cysteine peptidase family C39 domain-containing protein n=1 Tax=Clostridium beijerinckii TaxID=1520 RepID=UPI00156D59D0|nr:cysteine peptidase family C39 domain-containing protein [Clostridium beijerinckii]
MGEKVKNKRLVIADPARGKQKISINEFEKSFLNIIICSTVEPNKENILDFSNYSITLIKYKKIAKDDSFAIFKYSIKTGIQIYFISCFRCK